VTNKLRIKLALISHPYPNSPGAELEAWGRIGIYLLNNKSIKLLFEVEWDIALFIEWLVENQETLATEYLEIQGHTPLPSESLAQALDRFRERDFSEEEEEQEAIWFDSLYAYCTRHDLWFGLIGTKVPNIYIGCNHGHGEISLDLEGQEPKSYQFDMPDFLSSFANEIKHILTEWRERTLDKRVHNRCDVIIERLVH
jgi:hypothetical protein